jgi:integrase
MAPYIPLVQSGAMSVEEFKDKLNGMRELTKQDLDTFLLRMLEADILEAESLPVIGKIAKGMGEMISNPAATAAAAGEHAKAAQSWVYQGDEGSELLIKANFLHQNIDPSSLAKEISAASTTLDMSKAKLYQAYQAFYDGDFTKYEQLVNSLKSKLPTVSASKQRIPLSDSVTTNEKDNTSPAIKLSEAWKMYVADKGQKWRRAVAGENQRFYEILFYVVGDIPVDGISRQQIREALRVAENLPTRTRRPYSSMSLAECIAYDVPEEDLISSEHVHKHLKIWRSFFKTYLVEREDLLTTSPTKGISYETKPNRGGNYSACEMNSIKRHLENLPDHDWRKYYFLTLIYTGARRGEIADIRKHHIRQDDETSRWYIFIEGGKTDHAKRQIPIHKNLEDGLFGRIAPMAVDDLVFGDLPDYTTITNRWVEMMRELSMPDYTEFGFKRRIHSLRHTFISKALRRIGNSTLVKFAVGHSHKKNLGITDTYNHIPPLVDLLPVVDCQHE